jgi:type IV secretion system protein VirB9
MGQAQGLQFHVGNLDQQFRQLFPESFDQALTGNSQVLAAKARLDTARAADQQTMGVQAQVVEAVQADATTLNAIVARSQGAEGALQVGQATNQLLALKRTHILVKPFTAGLATNLVVTTDRRSYHLSLTSTGATAMAAISWIYPRDALLALQRAAAEKAAAAPVAAGLALEQLHFNYSVSGDRPNWRPLRAFDDGRQTFIEFPANLGAGEAPPLFLVDAKGDAQLVNYRLHGRFYVVDRLFDAAELRLGTKKQQIVRITRVADAPRPRRGS